MTLSPPLQPKSLRLSPSPRRLLLMALAFGGICHGNSPLLPTCSCPPPAPNQAGHSPPTLSGIAGISGGCVSPRFPLHTILLHRPQLLVAGEDCTSQVLDCCQLGQGETHIELSGISL